jgi:hypothetical protein
VFEHGCRDPKAVESFTRSFVLQCGVVASKQGLHKNDSQFVRQAIQSAQHLQELIESNDRSFNMPASLKEQKFINKLKQGLARKVLNKLDVLAQLVRMLKSVVIEIYKAKDMQFDDRKSIDDLVNSVSMEEIVDKLPLGDYRPNWCLVAPWWDLNCDKHLIIVVFET